MRAFVTGEYFYFYKETYPCKIQLFNMKSEKSLILLSQAFSALTALESLLADEVKAATSDKIEGFSLDSSDCNKTISKRKPKGPSPADRLAALEKALEEDIL